MPFLLTITKDAKGASPGETFVSGASYSTDSLDYAERLIRDGIAEPANDEAKELLTLIEREAAIKSDLANVNAVDRAAELLAKRREKVASAEKLLSERKKQVIGE